MSSSEEDISLLREAVDPQFARHFKGNVNEIPEQNAKACSSGSKPNGGGTIQPSVRRSSTNIFHDDLETSPEFKNHIAKRLQKILDSQLEMREEYQEFPVNEKSTDNYGIRLFASSRSMLPSSKRDATPPRPGHKPDLLKKARKSRKTEKSSSSSSSSSSSDEMDKFASVAVSSDWVLSKRGVFSGQEDRTNDPGAASANGIEAKESTVIGGGHHRNVCRKRKHKDSGEKDRPDKCASIENSQHETEDPITKKHKRSKKKKHHA